MKTKVLDCTFRDGGYYNDWDFDEGLISSYLAATVTAKIDIVEIGFRFFAANRFLGALAYSTDKYLKSLAIPRTLTICVMVNANDLITYEHGPLKGVDALFSQSIESPVDVVRIATHVRDIEGCESIARRLTELGYRVMLNIMQISSIDGEKLTEVARSISEWNCIEVLYFADSLGNMDANDVKETIANLSSGWSAEIGVHAHDNKGQALSNCIASLNLGVTYLDSTILGMGRGAGNVKSENLLVELAQRGIGDYFPNALFPLALQNFQTLKDIYGWGPNIYYFLSAVYAIHPTYIQEMIGTDRYSTEQILESIEFLKSTDASFYSFENQLRSMAGQIGSIEGGWSAANWAESRPVLIIGSGRSTGRYIKFLCRYIEIIKPVVLCLNINEDVPEDVVTAYVACHESRILMEADRYSRLLKPLIVPLYRIPEGIRRALNNTEILDYGLCVEGGDMEITKSGCRLHSPLAFAYALSIATAAGASNILMAGVDGYDIADPRHKELTETLNAYFKLKTAVPIAAITPTTLSVTCRSLFEPGLF